MIPPLPLGLAPHSGTRQGREWLDALPRLVAECASSWSLEIGEPFPYATASLALKCTLPTGRDAVLKIQFPHRESEHEAAALAHWDGDGAIRLIAHDAARAALLLERCDPGTPLSRLDHDAALDVMVDLLPRLWKPAGAPFRPLAEEAEWWAEHLAGKWRRAGEPFERGLVDAALDAIATLSLSQGEQVLVHQDLHADNVLRAQREPWLAIDPKPLAGEREFGIAAIVRGAELGSDPRLLRRRLDRLCSALGLDRERARAWAFVQTLAWAFDGDDVFLELVDTARSLCDARPRGGGASDPL